MRIIKSKIRHIMTSNAAKLEDRDDKILNKKKFDLLILQH